MGIIRDFISWITTPTGSRPPSPPPLLRPLTEGKTRGNIKSPPENDRPRRPTAAPGAPKPKNTKCKWIEVYVPDFQDSHKIEHHDNAEFREGPNGHLIVIRACGDTVVYRDYNKYVTRR